MESKTISQTGKERILQAMDGGKPAQIPVSPMPDWSYVVRSTGYDPFDWAYRGFEKQMEMILGAYQRLQADMMMIWTNWRDDAPKKMVIEDGKRYVVDHETGERTLLPDAGEPPWDNLIKDPYWQTQLPVAVYDFSGDGSQNTEKWVKSVIKRFVTSIDDVKTNMQPVISADEFVARGGADALKIAVEKVGHDTFLNAGYCGLAPDLRTALGGETNAFLAMAQDPKLVEAVLDHLIARYSEEIKAHAQFGADGIWMRAYYEGSDIISPKMWRQLFYPRHKAFCDVCHENGVRAVLWFLGDCLPLVEDIAEAGYDLLYVEQDRRGYTSDPAELRKRIGTDLCITGWTYELDMINDDREAISKTIRHQIENAGQDGAFVYGSTYIGADVNPATVDFMFEEVRRIWAETQSA